MQAADRRQRLQALLKLGRMMRGWTRLELSSELGRDPTKLVPASGNPKLDLVEALARVLSWPVEEVVYAIRGGDEEDPHDDLERVPFEPEAMSIFIADARRHRRWEDLRAAGTVLHRQADDGEQRGLGDHLVANAWAGMGCFAVALSVSQRGLGERGLSFATRTLLALDSAVSHYALWNLVEAKAIATELLEQLDRRDRSDRLCRVATAAAHSIRGHARRREALAEAVPDAAMVNAASDDLATAEREYRWLNDDFGDVGDLGRSQVCRGGRLECEAVERGSVERAIEAFVEGLGEVVDLDSIGEVDLLESHGWWCVFGSNLALRSQDEVRGVRAMAILTNKCFEIADRLDHWAMRERSFTLEHFRRQRAWETEERFDDWVLDAEDLRVLMGTMGRFPRFRPVGWRILASAGFVDA